MKKILCLFALLMALCTAFTTVYADSALTEAIEYLSAAGIELEYEEETIQPDQRVTRAVFAQNVAKLINMSEIECNNAYYHDVSEDHWAFDNVGVLTVLGVLTGNGKKYFYPDEYISRNEAATIVVSALGYSMYADNYGGFPNGYLKVANELELFDNCSTNADITLSDALIMLRNALDANVANATMSKNELVYAKSDETVLSFYHDKYYGKGTLTGCEGITFEAGTIKDDEVTIDGVEYTTTLTGLLDIIGTEVEFLYEADEVDSNERKLVWARSLDRNDFIDIQKDENCRFDDDQYAFYYVPEGSGKLKKLNLSQGIIVIYNGAISTENVADVLNYDKYKVRFIKSKGSSAYDIAIVWKYDNIVVGVVDSYEELIYDKFDQGNTLDISDNREKIVIEGGKTLDMLEDGDILSFYESEDGRLLKLEISKTVVEVTAKWIEDEDAEKILVTDSEEYVFYNKDEDVNVINGETITLYLDINGYIAAIDKVKTEGFPAYLIKALYDEDANALILKTLDYDGNIVKRTITDEKIKLDGTSTEMDAVFSALTSDEGTISQVLILKLNDNGEIKAIDTTTVGSKETADATLRCYERNHTGQYKHHGRLVPKYLISQSTIIFSVPSVATGDDRDYLVKSKSDMSNDQWYTFDIYRYSEGPIGAEELLVIKDKEWALSGNSGKIYVLVDKILRVLNEDGDPVEELHFNREGNSLKTTTTADFSLTDLGVKSGDLILLSTNMKGEIKDAEIKYSYGSDERPINTMYNAEPGLRVVYAHEKVGNVLRIGHTSGATYDEIFEMSDNNIVVYDEDADEKIRKGTMWDIQDFVSVGNSCTTVAIQTIDETPYFVVIYK